jgi:hypothetical protein
MNYYAKGGQAHGLKALAQELPKYGRNGDTMVAHINPQEAGILKALGGSGTINPTTGLPEYFIKKIFKPVQQAASAVTQGVKAVQNIPGIKQVSDLSTQAFKPIDQALVGLDKSVGKMIPGGWGTIAQTVAAMTPGMQPLAIGIGAANGSGVLRKGGSFNLQGAMIGGATAYATSELGEYLRAAGGVNATGSTPAMIPESAYANVIPGELGDIAVNSQGQLLNASGQVLNPATQAASGAINAAPTLANSASYVSPSTLQDQYVQQGLQEQVTALRSSPSFFDKATSLDTYTKPFEGAGSSIYDAGKSVVQAPGKAIDAIANYDYSGALDNSLKGMSDTGSGIKNLMGLGEGTVKQAMAAGATSGVKALPMVGLAAYGTMSLADLDAQRDFLKQQKAAGNIADAEYNAAMAEVNRSTEDARRAVRESPFSTNPNRDVSIGETYYDRGNESDNIYARGNENTTLYAMGGSVDDEYGMDEARGLNQGNLQNGLFARSMPSYAAGGMPPRFLSGGGDGMSDDIKATINGNQEARLADGEFVVPADVVSHLGNGSSKAGAKQLYSMMDKVRTARTGRKSQGKQINPRKYLAA